MTTDRIKEIQDKTAFPDSVSVCQALLKVWNECEQDSLEIIKIQQELIKVLESQVIDLSMMSKIELGDDVIEEIKRLKEIINDKIN
jgi:hypothetical protein